MISGRPGVLAAIRPIGRGRPVVSTGGAAGGWAGMRSPPARSLPRPAGMIPKLAPVAAAMPASAPAMPSPPTATITSPRPPASAASSRAWGRLVDSTTRYPAPAAASADLADGRIARARPLPAAGLTMRHSGRSTQISSFLGCKGYRRSGVRSGAMAAQRDEARGEARFLHVQTTTDSRAEAMELAHDSGQARLAACAQVDGPVAGTFVG